MSTETITSPRWARKRQQKVKAAMMREAKHSKFECQEESPVFLQAEGVDSELQLSEEAAAIPAEACV
ncbi:MAG: hypothetical protein A6F71_09820 [Cycloclasticus sp. symbiont of Poecilosclerida sp. M]|nr:MAG: hypothetical protein A6F71_09820 [Cycloclasticus sp. symbiont of Poecilosclerida sp. M]